MISLTAYSYLGLSAEVLDEEVAGKLVKSFQYSPRGERLSQVKSTDDNREESSYYGYNPHTDVEQITSETGDTRATYGYTAYGKNDDKLFTGIDKPDPADPTAKEEYNPYRFNGKRWDNSTGMYDMGFRNYNPGLNRFLNLDSYNGALDDLSLGLDPWTSNRYAFTGGNPINNIELDGHIVDGCGDGSGRMECAPTLQQKVDSKTATPADVAEYSSNTHISNLSKSDKTKVTMAAVGQKNPDAVNKWTARNRDRTADGVIDFVKEVAYGDIKGCVQSDLESCAWAAFDVFSMKVGSIVRKAGKAVVDNILSCGHSFVPGTEVLMADGTRKPIEDVEAGDEVLATDPETGETRAERVTAVMTSKGDKRLVQISIDTDGDEGDKHGSIIATDHHPFWVPALRQWVRADELKPGMWLRTSAGTYVQISAINKWTAVQRVHNMTVEDLHSYYVLAADTSVLVHNSCPSFVDKARDGLAGKRETTGKIFDEGGNPIELEFSDGVPLGNELTSGYDELSGAVDGYLGKNFYTASHVETKYAMWMRLSGLKHAQVVINKAMWNAPVNCYGLVSRILPKGWSMSVWEPGAQSAKTIRGTGPPAY
ncbi:DddA-like double-stranded DNA deaminase toxin [Nonomuraea sp. NPDC050680]|uniref:DddA-like double-stranded DNA deaminase toxin n=1 Tax=Nonomuraea sp. NPDC050680 TaxID=3154630 RepID=UPI0033C380E6